MRSICLVVELWNHFAVSFHIDCMGTDVVFHLHHNRSHHFVTHCVLVIDFEHKTATHEWDLGRHQELFVPINRATFLLCQHFGREPRRPMVKPHIRINVAFATKQGSVQWHYLLCLVQSDLELVELWLDLWRLEHIVLSGIGVIIDGHLLVSLTCNRDTDLEVASDLSKVVTLRVAHDEPLVHEGMVFAGVEPTQVKLVVADQGVFEESFVEEFDLDFAFFESFFLDVLGLEEYVLVPLCYANSINVILSSGKFPLSKTVDLHNWINCCTFTINFEVLGLLNKHVNHVVSSLHGRDTALSTLVS